MKLIGKSFKTVGAICLGTFAICGLVSCNNNDGEEAISRLSLLLDEKVDASESGLNANLEVPYSVTVNSKDYVVDYTTTNANAAVDKNDETKKTEIVITQTSEEQSFTLTASVAGKEKSWDFKIAARDLSMIKTQAEVNAMENLVDYAGWASKTTGAVVIQGYITHIHGYSASHGNVSMWLQDDAGGYYAYRVKVASQRDYEEFLQVGNKVAIAGTVSPYNGWQEMGNGSTYYYISDAQPKTYEFKDVAELWGSHTPDSADSKAVQNQKLTVTGKITSIPDFSSDRMTLGLSVNGNEYSVFIKSDYVGKISKDILSNLKVGYTVKVNGLGSVTKLDGKEVAQICLADNNSISVESTEVTAQDKVNGAVAEVKNQAILASYYNSMENPLDLLTTTKDGCTVTYALSEGAGAGITLVDNKLNVAVSATEVYKATLTATISLEGAESKTHSWKIVTKTDADVVAEITDEIENQDIKLNFVDSIGSRIELFVPVSPSKDLEYSYTIKDAVEDPEKVYLVKNEYLGLGQYKTGKYYFDLINLPEEGQVTFQLECHFTYAGGEEQVVTFTIALGENPTHVMVTKDTLQENVPYLFELTQGNLSKELYFTGEMDGYYFGTTENMAEAKAIYLEKTADGYYLAFRGSENAKKYISLVLNGNYKNLVFSDTPTTVWVFDETYNTFTTTLSDGKTYYMGTSKTFKTISASEIKYASKDGNFVSHLYTTPNVEVDAPYAMYIYQGKNEKHLYFNGKMSGFYGATTEVAAELVNVYFELTDGGYYMYFSGEGDAKTYINAVKSGKYINFKLETTPSSVWNMNVQYGTMTTMLDSEEYYLGTYSTHNTISVSSISKISTSFPCRYLVGALTGVENPEENPEVNPDVNPDVTDADVVINSTALGLTDSYVSSEGVVVGNTTIAWNRLADYGNGIQWSAKNNDKGQGYLWNTVALEKGISKIVIVLNAAKAGHSNEDALLFEFGTAADALNASVTMSTVAGQTTYEITPDANTYTFFKISNNINYAMYIDSINIYFAE